MNLPSLDLGSLPGLETMTGLFGSLAAAAPTIDDRIIILMVYVYETAPPEGFM